jgi:Tol biopolymer transport system component
MSLVLVLTRTIAVSDALGLHEAAGRAYLRGGLGAAFVCLGWLSGHAQVDRVLLDLRGESRCLYGCGGRLESRRLTHDAFDDITPSWSADGKQIAFASDRFGFMEIYLMSADGLGVRQLTHDDHYADDPRFTADGRYVVFEFKKGSNWEIRRINFDDTGEVNLTQNHAADRYPTTSPNGRLVAFSSNRGKGSEEH